ncbi:MULTISPECIES: ABC transporter ATP-binding protein [Exiguobacterium]|uniref:ABC transporter ATP-binding protein n=1 Tax=Exiguobacterium TaxID=33986 RepID=UPI001BE9ECFE|nr:MULTISPECIES: ABC transporter ATP-binding protein [Exiguobacterium]MCT4777053.1 ABC transporter ATP-binding protein [Exiguobacterium aquaticum]MCT4789469.1 ABC transporter ATP-binding protein [Exiguobacterium mexicanum]
MTLIEVERLTKTYGSGDNEQTVLRGIDLEIQEGEFVAILGPSGSGKSTLINILGCLDGYTSGRYRFGDKDVTGLSENELSLFRNKQIGFIFQQFNLLPRLSAYENVELPLIYQRSSKADRQARTKQMLTRVGLGDKLGAFPNQLSGGQQQRVAIARALVTNPSLLLADEPTGALDQANGRQIMKLFHDLHAEGKTIIMITHDIDIAREATRIVHVRDGKIEKEERVR